MRCEQAVRDLGRVPARGLRLWLRDLPEEAWQETPLRQDRFLVHRQTQSIVLQWAEHQAWPELLVHRGPRYQQVEDLVLPLLVIVVERLGGGLRVANLMLARLPGGTDIPRHFDSAAFFAHAHRVHLPLRTHDGVRFLVDDRPQPMVPSHLYELDNLRPHAVYNPGPGDRVHLIADLVAA